MWLSHDYCKKVNEHGWGVTPCATMNIDVPKKIKFFQRLSVLGINRNLAMCNVQSVTRPWALF